MRSSEGAAEGTTPETQAQGDTAERAEDDWRVGASERLRAAGVRGVLLWMDEDCVAHELRLPEIESLQELDLGSCEFTVTPGGWVDVARVSAPDPQDGGARCRSDRRTLEVSGAAVGGRLTLPGCAPAYKPNGTLTFVRDGGVLALGRCGDGVCSRDVLTRGDVRRIFGRLPWSFAAPAVREVAWLTDRRYAVIVHDNRTGLDAVAVLQGKRFVGGPSAPYELLSTLRISPRGSYVAVRINRQALAVLDRDGSGGSFSLRSARAAAWSRDDQWAAAATNESIFLFEAGGLANDLIELPFPATDVAWFD